MSLENLLEKLYSLNCSFGQVVVSDDGSQQEHLEYIESLIPRFSFTLVKAPKNKGLGNNINKGQDAITTPLTLYIQEDFEPKPMFPERLKYAIKFMEEDSTLDLVRFYAYSQYPTLSYFDRGFSKMKYDYFSSNYRKIYYYSDHPHLRRSDFFSKFGRYKEGLKTERTEYEMCISFIQNRGKGLFYNDIQALFSQKNTSQEPSTVSRDNWRRSDNYLITCIRDFYRQVKFNYDILHAKLRQ